MKHLLIISLLMVNTLIAQKNTTSNNFKVPESEFYQTKKLQELEEENKLLNTELNSWNSIASKLDNLQVKLEAIIAEELKKDDLVKKTNEALTEFTVPDSFSFTQTSFLNEKIDAFYNKYSNLIYDLNEDNFYGEESVNTLEYKTKITKLIDFFKTEKPKITVEISNTTAQKEDNDIKITKIIEEQENKKSIDKLAIILGLPAFCITILLLNLTPKLINKTNPDDKTKIDTESLEISTVLLLTMSILILGLSKMLTGEVLGTLIGGISGYVLNRNLTNR